MRSWRSFAASFRHPVETGKPQGCSLTLERPGDGFRPLVAPNIAFFRQDFDRAQDLYEEGGRLAGGERRSWSRRASRSSGA